MAEAEETLELMLKGFDQFEIEQKEKAKSLGTDVQDEATYDLFSKTNHRTTKNLLHRQSEAGSITEAGVSSSEGVKKHNKTHEVELPSASNPEAFSMEETLNTPMSMDKKKDEEPSKGLSDYEFYVKIAELLQHAKPDNVEVMVRAIVESVASYNEEKHAAENVGKAGTVREEAPMPSHGKEKEGSTAGTWQAGEQQVADLQVDPQMRTSLQVATDVLTGAVVTLGQDPGPPVVLKTTGEP
ncbi:MAG: hypothetical protein Q9161_003633 [Pseudevernia consocians]